MLSSMTGMGQGIGKVGELVAETEIKSLNSRFLDLSFRLPREVSINEFELRNEIKKYIKRGKLSITIKVQIPQSEKFKSTIDIDGLNNALELLKTLQKAANITDKLSIDTLLNLQQFYLTDKEINSDESIEAIKFSLVEALNELKKMRQQEGAELEKDLNERISNIEKNTIKIEGISKKSVEEYYNRFIDRANQLAKDYVNDEDRFRTELALLIEKYDTTEEIVRLKSHIKLFRDTIKNNSEAGRKLNFIVQEMNREANTINSKSVSTEILHTGILIKEELEKIREQIQNIE